MSLGTAANGESSLHAPERMPVLSKTLQAALKLLLSLGFIVGHFLQVSCPAWGQAGATLRGVVYFKGDVMPGFPVSLYSQDQVRQTEADKAGHFEFDNLPPGTYDLQGRYEGVEGTIYGVRIEDNSVGPLTLTADFVESVYPLSPDCGRTFWVSYEPNPTAGARVAGVLLMYPDNPSPNRLLASARIDLTAAEKSHHRISQHADENGKFEFHSVPPGRYSLCAHYRGYWKVQSTIWVTRKDTTVTKVILYKHGHPAICE